ncbi:MAG: SH3-like domain-containing protein [Ilumatobacteraceae bacterium]
MEGAHDLGGFDGFGPIITADADLTHHEAWELRAQALGIVGLGSLRQWIERLDPATYLSSPYYVRWLLAAELGAVQRGLIDGDDLARWNELFAADPSASPPKTADAAQRARVVGFMTREDQLPPAAAPRFAPGQTVVVRRWRDAEAHHRCPRYVRGVAGTIETCWGDEAVPGRERNLAPTYTVAFSSPDLWGDSDEPPFSLYIDLCEEYLEAAPA